MNRLKIVGTAIGFAAMASLSAAPVVAPAAHPVADSAAPAAVTAPPPSPDVDASIIRVVIDDSPVVFQGANPQRINGSVLVPLRGVFERLGATVQFHAETRTIEATRGATDLILRLGDANAYLNNQAVPLAQAPVLAGGATLVPLRFVAEVFGAQVSYKADQNLVDIRTGAAHSRTASSGIVGQVVSIDAVSVPNSITVRTKNDTIHCPVATDTIILQRLGDQPAAQTTLSSLKPGDYVEIARVSPEGPASTIRVVSAQLSGVVKDVLSLENGDHVIIWENGGNAEVAPDASITKDNAPATWADVKPGYQAIVRSEPEHHIGYSVDLQEEQLVAPAAPARDVVVDSFRIDATGPLKGGDTVTATLHGSAGGSAQFSIPSVVDTVQMKEQQPGVYEGSYVIPSTVNVNGANVIGRLTVPGGKAPVLIQAARTLTVDSKPPVIANLTPASNSEVSNGRPRISVTLDDGDGVGVDNASAHLFLDGQDITSGAIITPHFATYEPPIPLSNGEHKVRIVVGDNVGNASETAWTFVINARNGLVTSLSSNVTPQSSHISSTRPLHVVLRAQAGGKASFSVGAAASNIAMAEVKPGDYEGDYTPDRGAAADNVSVVAKFVAVNGSVITTTLDTPVTIDAAVATRPSITSPKPDGKAPGHCVIEGISAPNATVLVTVTYKSPSVGDLFKRSGPSASTQVQADESGHWRTEDLKLYAGGFFTTATGTQFTATAVIVDATGQQSAADVVHFWQK